MLIPDVVGVVGGILYYLNPDGLWDIVHTVQAAITGKSLDDVELHGSS